MTKDPAEWLRQAEYDMETADAMLAAGRFIYAVFMCHLSIEKALKGLYQKRLNELPPKIHNLLYFFEKLKLNMPDQMLDSIATLNKVSVPTRYPDDLQRILRDFSQTKTNDLLKDAKEVLRWIKTTFEK